MTSMTRNRTSQPKPNLKHGTICVIEDNDDIRAGLKEVLELDGFDVFATGDGRDALEHLQGGLRPDALLLDLYLPGVTGFEIYRVLRNDPQLSRIPVIVVTAASPAHRIGLEVVATIRKPLDVQELLLTVRRAVARE